MWYDWCGSSVWMPECFPAGQRESWTQAAGMPPLAVWRNSGTRLSAQRLTCENNQHLYDELFWSTVAWMLTITSCLCFEVTSKQKVVQLLLILTALNALSHNSLHMAWYCKTYAEGTVTEGPLGREKRWAVAPKRQAWYLTGLGDGFSRRTYNTHTHKKVADTNREKLLTENTWVKRKTISTWLIKWNQLYGT